MTPAAFIRKEVLGIKSQKAFASLIGVEQATVSRWEADGIIPSRAQRRVRELAIGQIGARWQDEWFFEVPSSPCSSEKGA